MATSQRGFLPRDADKKRYVREMFDRIAPRYGLVNSVMTFGLDRVWRDLAVTALALPPGSLVADLACGPGELCNRLYCAGYRPIGMDLSWGMLSMAKIANRSNRSMGASPARTPFTQCDAALLPLGNGAVDGITCGFALRNFSDVASVISEAARVLRPGGRLAVLEVSTPANRLLRFGHRIYFQRVVPRIGGLLSDSTAYRYLPESVTYLPCPEELAMMLSTSGFDGIRRRQLTGGATQLVTATRSWNR